MKRTALLALAASSLLFAACGGAPGATLGGGKDGAATAVFTAAQASLAQDGFLDDNASGAQSTGFTRACAQGGSVAVTVDASGGALPSFVADYKGCSVDGLTKLDGKASLTLLVEKVGSGVAATVTFTGKLALSGEITDTLEFDVTQTASVKSLRTEDANVTLTLRGFVQTTAARYEYANEPITLTPGKLTPAPLPTDRSSRT